MTSLAACSYSVGLHPPIPTITLPYPRAWPGGWVVVGVHAMPLTAVLCPQSPGLPRGGGGGSSGWLVLYWGVLCAVCCSSAVRNYCAQNPPIGRAGAVDVKYPCSCMASFPFSSHHLGLALGGAVVLFPAPLGHRWSETSSGDEPPAPTLHLGSPLGVDRVPWVLPPCRIWSQTNLGV